jgi:hypothetical protein
MLIFGLFGRSIGVQSIAPVIAGLFVSEIIYEELFAYSLYQFLLGAE